MPKRTRYDDDYSFTPDSFSLLPTPSSLGLPECDTAWVFETDPDPTQMQFSDCDTAWVFDTEADPAQAQVQVQAQAQSRTTQRPFSDFGSSDIDIPALQSLPLSIHSNTNTNTNTHADLLASQDLSSRYQTSNGSSLSVPASQSTSASSAMFLWSSSSSSSRSSSPRYPVAVEAQPHTGQINLCRSLCRSETCLTAALRALSTLHVAHAACLSAHQEAPTVQQARKMETVLSMNKDVVAGMAPILACSCSAKSLLQLLLLSICGNLIAWNSAMISADFEPGDPFSSACSPPGTGAGAGAGARVLAQPITIGQHQIKGKLGRALHAQVMAGELRILEGLVDAVSRRLCEASRLEGASSASPATQTRNLNGRASGATSRDMSQSQSQLKGLSHVVHRHIISSLRTRLENTRAKIFSGLGQAA